MRATPTTEPPVKRTMVVTMAGPLDETGGFVAGFPRWVTGMAGAEVVVIDVVDGPGAAGSVERRGSLVADVLTEERLAEHAEVAAAIIDATSTTCSSRGLRAW